MEHASEASAPGVAGADAPLGSEPPIAVLMLADLAPGHDLRSRPLGELRAECRNKLGKDWRDVTRWAIASCSYDMLGDEWKATSEFRVATGSTREGTPAIDVAAVAGAALGRIERHNEELLAVPRDAMSSAWAATMAEADLSALSEIGERGERHFACVAIGHNAGTQVTYREALQRLASRPVLDEVQHVCDESDRRMAAKEERKAFEMARTGPIADLEARPGTLAGDEQPDALSAPAYQLRALEWAATCFGTRAATDRRERNHSFLEEALELGQAAGATAEEAHLLVDYVFGRPVGEFPQEVGGTVLTLALLCESHGQKMDFCGEAELIRVWGKLEQIRVKQAAKSVDSPLPGFSEPTSL